MGILRSIWTDLSFLFWVLTELPKEFQSYSGGYGLILNLKVTFSIARDVRKWGLLWEVLHTAKHIRLKTLNRKYMTIIKSPVGGDFENGNFPLMRVMTCAAAEWDVSSYNEAEAELIDYYYCDVCGVDYPVDEQCEYH